MRHLAGTAALLLLVTSCDGSPVLFPDAASVEMELPAGGWEGLVGEPLAPAPELRLVDAAGNPVPGAAVHLEIVAGDGSLAGSPRVSDRRGRVALAGWTLGEVAGPNRIVARVAPRGADAPGSSAPSVEVSALGVAGPPVRLERLAPQELEGRVGEPVEAPLQVRALDRFDNPVPGREIAFVITQGGGSTGAGVAVTDAAGTAGPGSWTLGTQAGPQALEARVTGVLGVNLAFQATALPGPPAELRLAGELPAEGTVNEPLAGHAEVHVRDAYGNAVPGINVTFAPAPGSGAVAFDTATSGAGGAVVLPTWTLGTVAGTQTLRVTTPGAPPLDLEVEALPGPPASLEAATATTFSVLRGTAVMPPPAVRVRDQFLNPVPGVVVRFEGQGTVSGSPAETDAVGVAEVGSWTVRDAEGLDVLEAALDPAVDDVPPVAFLATVVDSDPASGTWTIEGVHLNQGSQTLDGTLALVAGRPGLLRVFLRGTTTSAAGVRVRVRLRAGASTLLDQTVARSGGGGIGTGLPDLESLAASWNVAVPGSAVVAGLEMRVDVDPDGVLGLPPGSPLQWPAGGGWESAQVLELPTFRSTFIPVYAEYYDLTGRITPGNVDDYLAETLDAFPIGDHDFEVRTTPFVYDGSFDDVSAGWTGLLQEIRDLRLAESGLDRYYHGIVQRPSGPGVAGIAYVATQPLGTQNLAAVSFDALPTARSAIAHEIGHNFGRYHTPCGVSSGMDLDYPHAGARLGSPGYSSANGALRTDAEYRDVMSYCFPLWPSDYTYGAILAMRDARPVGAPPATMAGAGLASSAGPTGPALLVGGGWSASQGTTLRPAVALEAAETLEAPGGSVRIELFDAAGRLLVARRHEGAPVDHADDPTLRHFAAVIPLPSGRNPGDVARVRVTTPGGTTERRSAQLRPDAEASPELTITADRPVRGPAGALRPSVRVSWDAEQWPVLVLRHGSDGRIAGFLRSGSARIPLPDSPAAAPALPGPGVPLSLDALEALGIALSASDGVRTLRAR
jgi:hypothetical protein